MSNKTSIISAVVGALLVTTSLLIVSKTYSNSEDNSLGYTLSNWQGAINVLQWNPHWQCFKNPTCTSTVASYVASLASQHSLDFANLIELEDNNWRPSDPKYKLGSSSSNNHRISCGMDMLITMYDSSKWTPLSDGHAGCLVYAGRKDRPYLVQTFKLNADPSMKVVFVGAHFSHPGDAYYDSGLSQHLHCICYLFIP